MSNHYHLKHLTENYDKFMYIIVIIAPLTNLPQLLSIWISKDASGVSPISWFSFALISIVWFVYGILHKDKRIIIMNILLMFFQLLIALGAIIYS